MKIKIRFRIYTHPAYYFSLIPTIIYEREPVTIQKGTFSILFTFLSFRLYVRFYKYYKIKFMILKKFDPIIYPYKIWVVKEANGTELNGIFTFAHSDEPLDFIYELEKYKCTTFAVHNTQDNEYGALIVFKEEPQAWDVSHESFHAACFCFDHLGEPCKQGEPLAYLVEFIVKCCYEVKIGESKEKLMYCINCKKNTTGSNICEEGHVISYNKLCEDYEP
jgi:hypothetical protein